MNESTSVKTLVDFGGRRKIFDRRHFFRHMNNPARKPFERRSWEKRRSGFDRRSILKNSREWPRIERRLLFFIPNRIEQDYMDFQINKFT